MFYGFKSRFYLKACRVTGKNLTPCTEIKKEGADVILIDFEQDKGNVIVCDCVGILKERHSDIEGKMEVQKMRTNWKKKSTKCRMVFRTEVELASGKTEILQGLIIIKTLTWTNQQC